jgi:hypothetical protein
LAAFAFWRNRHVGDSYFVICLWLEIIVYDNHVA